MPPDDMLRLTPMKGEERQKRFRTLSGAEVDRVYEASDGDAADYAKRLGDPGQYPYTRGIRETM